MALANYASLCTNSKGRKFKKSIDPNRDCYQKDRDRIIHSSLFRKLMYKTQVFINYKGDYYRTRLTHSLEVAQIARSIARRLKLNEDLTEAIALAHDVGHPPFGHAGEDGIQEAAKNHYKFDHNAQALRALMQLEKKYMEHDGLDLTWESVEGIAKHNGPIKDPHQIIQDYDRLFDLQLSLYPSLEAQVASVSDDIAYNTHDIDDGVRANLLNYQEIRLLPIIGNFVTELETKFSQCAKSRILYSAIRKTVGYLVEDIIKNTSLNIKKNDVKDVNDVRNCGAALVSFSLNCQRDLKEIKKFLSKKMYSDYRVNRITKQAKKIVGDLFFAFYHDTKCIPKEWQDLLQNCTTQNKKAQIICDFVSGMTDRFAIKEHKRLFDSSELISFDSRY